MYPKRMKRVDIFLMRSDLDRMVAHLHDQRILHHVSSGGKDIKVDPKLLDVKSRVDKIIELLAPYETFSKGLLKQYLMEKPAPVQISEGKAVSGAEKWLREAQARTEPFLQKRSRIEDDIGYLRELREKLVLLGGLDFDLHTVSSFERIRIKVGTTRRFHELKGIVSKAGGDLQSSLLDKKEGLHAVRILYTSGNAGYIEESLRGRIFSEITFDIQKIASLLNRGTGSSSGLRNPVARLIVELDKLEDSLKQKRSSLRGDGDELATMLLNNARAWQEALEIEMEKTRMRSSLSSTIYTGMISGWIEGDRMRELRTIVDSSTRGRYHIQERDPDKTEIEENRVPTKLNNGRFASLFEPLTLTFAVPKYNEIDPSLFISVPFILFFGLMLGDAGYGLLILLPSLYVFTKGKKSNFLRQIGALGILMGLATTLAGIWMGSLFGDLVPRLIFGSAEKPLYSFTVLGMSFPYDTLRDPMLLFEISLWLGFIQLNAGFALLGYDRLKKRDFWGFVKGALSWAFVQSGAVIFLGGILFGWWGLSMPLAISGGAFFLLGCFLLFFEVGPMFLFSIEGLMGDWISYSRILALGLSTFGLAMAFNIVGEMMVGITPYLLPVVAILLLALHIFNLLLQTLGAAVHSVRLQFVEFFGRFFEGGGELFQPFGRERAYTKSHTDIIGAEGREGR
ncbi:MAG: V-type ATP synthase subunit I [Thermoplasmatota archaeon]